jgi:hypothetical protein
VAAVADAQDSQQARKRAVLRNALILAVIAAALYAGIFLVVSWRHP